MRRLALSLATLAAATGLAWDKPLVKPDLPLIFPDDALVEAQDGVDLAFHQGVKDRDPVLRKDRPWEKKGCHVYGSVWKMDDGSYRMWYNDWSYSLVADSTDGKNWVKPYLTANPSEAYPSNNLCKNAYGHCNSLVFDGFEVDPERRYKHIGTGYSMNADGTINTNRTGYYTCVSKDGLVFTDYRRALYGWDTDSLALHPETGDIFCYHKIMTGGIAGRPVKRRVVYEAHTSDFSNWSSPQLVLAPDAEDDASFEGGDSKRMDIYTHTAFAYAGGFIGFMTMFKIDQSTPRANDETTDYGISEVQVATSPDGLSWARTPKREYVLTAGTAGNWDCGGIWGIAGGEVVSVGDESMLYYYGLDNAHGRPMRSQASEISTGRAVWRRWGFASRGTAASGSFTTKPVRFQTDDLRLNAAPEGTGGMSVTVSVYAENGNAPVAESQPVTADATLARLVWKNGATIPTNTPVRLKFDLKAARVYAVECVGPRVKYTPLDRPVWKYDTRGRPADETSEASATLSAAVLNGGAALLASASAESLETRYYSSFTLPAIRSFDESTEELWPHGTLLFIH